ncbi:hypothetical protein Droror1_Dr00007806 [Drosera rotundifolia]
MPSPQGYRLFDWYPIRLSATNHSNPYYILGVIQSWAAAAACGGGAEDEWRRRMSLAEEGRREMGQWGEVRFQRGRMSGSGVTVSREKENLKR